VAIIPVPPVFSKYSLSFMSSPSFRLKDITAPGACKLGPEIH
jgi:hypothetical protein